MIFTEQYIAVATLTGNQRKERMVTTPAKTAQGLAYHASATHFGKWDVTHIETGRRLNPYAFATEAEAQAFMALHLALPIDWHGTKDQIAAQVKPNVAVLGAIADAVREAFAPTRHANANAYTYSYATVTETPGENWHIACTYYVGTSAVNDKTWYIETDHVHGENCGDAEADARRLAACWNVLHDIPQATLDDPTFHTAVLELAKAAKP